MDTPRIPIRNLYYLLCYAWNQLPQGDLVNVSRLPSTELVDLFAKVLCDGAEHLARRGLEQGYILHEEEITTLRGRVDLWQSARRFLPANGRALCRFDELSPNTLANRILKASLRRLERTDGLHKSLRQRVQALLRGLREIDDIRLTSHTFKRVQLYSNSQFYRFLLNVCELIQHESLVDKQAGAYRFRDFFRDEVKMAGVFQNFLFNFIRLEIPAWTTRREIIKWNATSSSDPELSLLPRMETDISLTDGARHLIVDAKYYQATFAKRFDAEKVYSGHLYQMFAYLANRSVSPGHTIEGMLIYPRVERAVRERYTFHETYPVTVATVDLAQPWEEIRQEIIDLIR